jgi:hypothetical protein
MQMALSALKHLCLHTSAIKGYDGEQVQTACDALRACLAQPEPEPVAYLTKRKVSGTEGLLMAYMVDMSAKNKETHDFIPLYTTPPQRIWQGLTDEEISGCINATVSLDKGQFLVEFSKAIEAKLRDKNS